MNVHRRRIVAAVGLGGMLIFCGLLLSAAAVVSAPDGFKRFQAWRLNAEYLGTDGVLLQDKRNNCGPAALKMVLDYYNIPSTLGEIEERVGLTEKGSSMLALKEMAELKGLRAEGWRFTLEDFLKAPKPVIVFVHGDHFAVVDSVTDSGEVFLRDPAIGKIKLPKTKLQAVWNGETLVFSRK